MFKEA
jgi:intraflagellar transport protein 122